jgi:hypothetical protein
MVLIGYRHGLRASELCDLQWSQVELCLAGDPQVGPKKAGGRHDGLGPISSELPIQALINFRMTINLTAAKKLLETDEAAGVPRRFRTIQGCPTTGRPLRGRLSAREAGCPG